MPTKAKPTPTRANTRSRRRLTEDEDDIRVAIERADEPTISIEEHVRSQGYRLVRVAGKTKLERKR